jgi:hypothetical protein
MVGLLVVAAAVAMEHLAIQAQEDLAGLAVVE